MNSTKWIWRSVSTISIVSTLLLLVGFIYAVKDVNAPQAGRELPQPTQQLGEGVSDSMDEKQEYKISAIGDSLAKGTGDDTGKGYVKRSVDLLKMSSKRKTSLLNNLGINGLTTEGLLAKLDEPGVQYVLKQSDIIILSIGGNDLFRGAQLLSTEAGNTDESASSDGSTNDITAENLRGILPKSSERLQLSLEKLRGINPEAYIIYVGLYNPFGDLPQLSSIGNEVVTTWNNIAQTKINQDKSMLFVPTYDLFTRHLGQYLATDHFHPNGDGYQQIADRIVRAIE